MAAFQTYVCVFAIRCVRTAVIGATCLSCGATASNLGEGGQDAQRFESPWADSTPWAETVGSYDPTPECEAYCSGGLCSEVDNCEPRCNEVLLGWARAIGEEHDSDCESAVIQTMDCAVDTGCLDSIDGPRPCAENIHSQIDDCGGEIVLSSGWESCHRLCDRVAVCSHVDVRYASWADCWGQCAANFRADEEVQCASYTLRAHACYIAAPVCYDPLGGSNPCRELEDAWISCVAEHG